MSYSSGLPRAKGLAGISRVVRARASATTVSRPTRTKGTLDETTDTTADHTEQLWLFEPQEAVAQEAVGERVNGALGGLAVADGTVDIDKDDRVTHGGVVYEVDTIVGHPEDDNADLWLISFNRRQ